MTVRPVVRDELGAGYLLRQVLGDAGREPDFRWRCGGGGRKACRFDAVQGYRTPHGLVLRLVWSDVERSDAILNRQIGTRLTRWVGDMGGDPTEGIVDWVELEGWRPDRQQAWTCPQHGAQQVDLGLVLDRFRRHLRYRPVV